MKNSKGFIAFPVLIAIIVAVLAVGGGAYVYVHNKQVKQPTVVVPTPNATSTAQTADWKTYIDPVFLFEIKYPPTWSQSIHGASLGLQPSSNGYGNVSVTTESSPDVVANCNGVTVSATTGRDTGKDITINGIVFHHGTTIDHSMSVTQEIDAYATVHHNACYQIKQIIEYPYNLYPRETVNAMLANARNIFNQIASTFKFTQSTSTAQVETPYIGSIFPLSALVGTTIEIRGSGLVGFEGDVYFFFKRSDGKIARLSGVVSTQTTGDAIRAQTARVILREPCQQGQTVYGDYSGKPSQCDYVQLTPGTYEVYTTPWAKKSNVVQFTITSGGTTQTADWKTYTNTQHGYVINYPANSKVSLIGYDRRYSLEDTISSTTNWYASTCVEIKDGSNWNILISTDAQYSSNPCGPTGTSATNHREIDVFSINSKQIKADGRVEPDSSGFFSFGASDNIGVIYFVNNSSTLELIHPVLSTFKLIPNFVPIAPPDDGRG